jgi:hypothetical protein
MKPDLQPTRTGRTGIRRKLPVALAPRGTSGEREGERGFPNCTHLLLCILLFAASFTATTLAAQTNEDEIPIPPLHPAHGELQPTFWEQNGMSVMLVAGISLIVLVVIVALLVKLLGTRRVEDPLVTVRRGLAALKSRPENAALVTEVSRLLRNYFRQTFGLSSDGLTTAELRDALSADIRIQPDLRAAIMDFLKRCDEFKFAPAPPARPLNALERAEELVKKVATWKREQLAAKGAL